MIQAREFRFSDISDIDRVFKNQNICNRIPSLANTIINSTLEDSETGEIVGYGVVNIFVEATMVLDSSLTRREKVIGFRELMRLAILYCKDAGVELLYASSTISSFRKILCKKYGFDNVPGALLCLDLTEEKIDE